MVQVVYLYDVYPTHCHARLGVQYQCESLLVTINGATSRCQGLPHEFDLSSFWLTGILTAVTSPDGMSRRYCNLCDHRWYSSCLAPYRAEQGEISQTPLKVKPTP